MKKILSFSARIAISAIFLYILFRKIDFNASLKIIARLDVVYFFIAMAIFFILYIFVLFRWKMLLDAQKVSLPLQRILVSYAGGLFFSLFLPSNIGGDLARTVDLGLHTKRRSLIAASVLLDRLSGFIGLVIVALSALFFGFKLVNEPSVLMILLLFAGILIAVLLVIFNNGIYRWLNRLLHAKKGIFDVIRKLHAEVYFFRSKPAVVCLNIFYSIIIQAGASVSSYFILRSLKVNINMVYPLIFNPVITVITSLPISLGGLGLRDAATVFFYAKAGVPKDIALAQSILNFTIILVFGLIGGIIYVSTLRYRRLQSHQTNSPV